MIRELSTSVLPLFEARWYPTSELPRQMVCPPRKSLSKHILSIFRAQPARVDNETVTNELMVSLFPRRFSFTALFLSLPFHSSIRYRPGSEAGAGRGCFFSCSSISSSRSGRNPNFDSRRSAPSQGFGYQRTLLGEIDAKRWFSAAFKKGVPAGSCSQYQTSIFLPALIPPSMAIGSSPERSQNA